MKILIVGYGSIGRRHFKNFIKFSEVRVFDEKNNKKKLPFFNDIKSSIEWEPDGVVIATPTDCHVDVAQNFIGKTRQILIEKPISNNFKSALEFEKLNKDKINEIFVVSNIRFHQALEVIKKKMNILGKIFFVRSHFGNWLPNMRPGVNYKNNYSSSREKSGGIILDCIHEIDYLNYLFGNIEKIYCLKKKKSNLDISVEDICILIIKHEDGVISELHLDYLRPIKKRGCEVVGANGTLIWESEGKDPEKCTVKYCDRKSKNFKNIFFDSNLDSNLPYENLAREFISSIKQGSKGKILTARNAVAQLKLIENCKVLD